MTTKLINLVNNNGLDVIFHGKLLGEHGTKSLYLTEGGNYVQHQKVSCLCELCSIERYDVWVFNSVAEVVKHNGLSSHSKEFYKVCKIYLDAAVRFVE